MGDVIKNPLWDLMVSTNACYPGCSCDDDFFDMKPEIVKIWFEENAHITVDELINQIDELFQNMENIYGDFENQINI